MEITLPAHIITDIAQEALELMEHEGYDTIDTESWVRNQLRGVYDDRIWEMVESEENTLELDFDDILNDLTDDVMSKVEYYRDNIRQG